MGARSSRIRHGNHNPWVRQWRAGGHRRPTSLGGCTHATGWTSPALWSFPDEFPPMLELSSLLPLMTLESAVSCEFAREKSTCLQSLLLSVCHSGHPLKCVPQPHLSVCSSRTALDQLLCLSIACHTARKQRHTLDNMFARRCSCVSQGDTLNLLRSPKFRQGGLRDRSKLILGANTSCCGLDTPSPLFGQHIPHMVTAAIDCALSHGLL
jgi:hypothetical protein